MPAPTTPARRRSAPLNGTVHPLPPAALTVAPREVASASRAFADALAKYRVAGAEERDARLQVDAARALDEQAAHAAVVAGRAVPDPTEPAAAEAHALAARTVPGAEQHARDMQNAYVATLAEHRERMLRDTLTAIDHIGEPARALVDEIEQTLAQLAGLRILARELSFPDALEGLLPMFNPVVRPGREVGREERPLLDGLRAALTTEQPAGSRFVTGRRAA
jgi:hypothetical protein